MRTTTAAVDAELEQIVHGTRGPLRRIRSRFGSDLPDELREALDTIEGALERIADIADLPERR